MVTRSRSAFPPRAGLLIWLVTVLLGCLPGRWAGAVNNPGPTQRAAPAQVAVIPVKGVINPILANFVDRAIGVAEKHNDAAAVLELDTPGGLDTSMREIVKRIMSSRVPVIVYVGPQGARAASAGMFITESAHVAAMAPNTAIGAAHPVAMGGGKIEGEMARKVLNDASAYVREVAGRRQRNVAWAEKAVRMSVSASATEALKLKVVDVVADTVPTLLSKVDGRVVQMEGGKRTLHTKGAVVERVEMNFIERFLFTISDPNIAYMLLSLGMLAVMAEMYAPGTLLPGIVGVIALLLAFFSLGMLPVNYAGLFLIIFAFVLFLSELWVTSHGALTVGGIISLTIGSLILINSQEPYLAISHTLIFGMVAAISSFFLFLMAMVLKSFGARVATGQESLIGRIGRAKTILSPGGMVLLEGELWQAQSEGPAIQPGEPVRVERLDGIKLIVTKPDNT